MADLRDRFQTLDAVPSRDLWSEIESRAVAMSRPTIDALPIVLVAVVVLVLAILGGAMSIGRNSVGPVESGAPGTSPSPATTPSQHAARPGVWTVTGDTRAARSGHTATLLPDGTVLVAGGFAGSDGLASAELYDPLTGVWTATASMLTGRGAHTATLLGDGTVLVVGGTGFAGPPGTDIELNSAERFDPRTGSWTATGSMIEARSGGAAVLLPDGRVLVAGGWGSTDRFGPKLATAELYDPLTGTWAATGRMTSPRHGHSATLLPDGSALVAGGYVDNRRLDSAELYDAVAGTWTTTGSLPEPYLGYSDVLLRDGTVLIAGGDVPRGGGAVGSAHAARYDPNTGTWTIAAEMQVPRLAQAAVLLPDGRILVMGGRVNGGPMAVTFATAEVYDPVSGTWALVAQMSVARSGHTATVLADGRTLVVGGLGNKSVNALASAELFDAAAAP